MTETMNLNHRRAAIWGAAAAFLLTGLIGVSAALAAGAQPVEIQPGLLEPSLQQGDFFGYAAGLPDSSGDTGSLVTRSPFVRSDPRAVAPFPLLLNNAVQSYVRGFLLQPGGLKLAFERSRPFLPEMVKAMRDKGIPDDLIYLSFAESYFTCKHLGPWQFEFDTAKRFGLRVNKWMDERQDPVLSTRAAAEYLAELHDQADRHDWRVALIGWNLGEGYLGQYWLLEGDNFTKFADKLPLRTSQLLNRFMAVAFIAHNASSYGLAQVSFTSTPSYETHKFSGGTPLSTIADKYKTTVAKLRRLNPALQTDQVPPSEKIYAIRVPSTHSDKASD